MDPDQIAEFRARLREKLSETETAGAASESGGDVVALDQQAIGRVSRIDAIQRQAIAKATDRRRAAETQRILHALKLMDEGEYGWCEACGEAIGVPRLNVDPAATRCIACAR